MILQVCEPRNLAFVLETWSGCIQAGWGSDLWLSAVVLWNSASHVSTMLRSNLDLPIIRSLIFYTPPLRSARCFSRRHRRALEKQGQKKQTKHSKQQDNTSMTVTVLVPGIRLFNLEIIVLVLRSTFATRFVCFLLSCLNLRMFTFSF